MSTIIDALIVSIGLDASKFTKGVKEAQQTTKKFKEDTVAQAKEIEGAMTAASAGVGKLAVAFLGLGAVLTGGKGVQQFMTDITKTDSALGRFARGVNMSTKDVQAFDGAVQSIGGSAGEAQAGIQALSDSFQSLKTFGDPGVVKALAILSSQGGKRIDPLRPVDKNTILDLAEDLGKIAKTDPTHASFLGRQLGLPPNVVSALMKGREEFAKLLDIQEKYAASQADIEAAERRQGAWQRLQAAGESYGRSILTVVTPALMEMNKAFLRFVEDMKTSLPQIKAAWDNFWAGFEPVAKPVFEFLKSALKGFGTFASDTFGLVKNAFFGSSDDIRNSWKKLFDDMNDTLSNWATEMWEKIPRIFKRIFDWIEGRFNAIWTAAFGRPLFPESGGAGAGAGDAGGAGGNRQLPRPQGHPGSDGGPVEHGAPIPGKGSSGGSAHGPQSPGGGPVEHSAPVGHSAAPAYGPQLPGGGKRALMGRGSGASGGSVGGVSPVGWWTQERIDHAINKLVESGVSELGAQALVARWAHVESTARGPLAHNDIGGGHSGIAQWGPNRGGAAALGMSFDEQLQKAIDELHSSESRSLNMLNNAKTPREAAVGASQFERAERYNPITGEDMWVGKTLRGMTAGRTNTATPSDTNAYTAPGAGVRKSFNGQPYTDYYPTPAEASAPKLKSNMTTAEINAWNAAHGGGAAGSAWQKALHSLARPHEHAKRLLQHISGNIPPVGAATSAQVANHHSTVNSHNTNASHEVKVGNVNVHMAPGSDAGAIVRDIKPALERASFASLGNYSLA